jgi:hypothetical protein
MPRIRSLKPDFFLDEDLAELPLWVRVLYEGLWCHADKEGRLEDRPQKLKAVIFPYDKYDVEDGLKRLALPKVHSPKHPPFIIRYEINGERYIQILAWDSHQSPHHTEKESAIPAFNGDLTVITPVLKGATGDAPEQGTMNLTKISFLQGGVWGGITEEDKRAWVDAYPACNIAQELLAMLEWIKANPAKGKKSNYRRFITNWLSRRQEKGGALRGIPEKGGGGRGCGDPHKFDGIGEEV